MLDGLRQFIADIVAPHAQDRAFGDSDYRLAATALLVHVVSLDGQPTATEQRKLHSLIESHFGLDRGTADRLIAERPRSRARRSTSITSPASSCARSTKRAASASSR